MEATRLEVEGIDSNLPSFARNLPSTRTAIRFAGHLHRMQRRASDDAPFILHPLEVASLLYNCGASERVITAGVLHDVIEDAIADGPVTREVWLQATRCRGPSASRAISLGASTSRRNAEQRTTFA